MSLTRTPSRSNASSACSLPNTDRSSVISTASMQRKLHKKEFAKYYADLCHLQHTHPLQAVKQFLDRGALDVVGDRIKFDDWFPIVTALRCDQSLHRIAVRLKHRAKYALLDADTELKAKNVTKQPVLTTKFVLYWLLEAVKKCLVQSSLLTVLELEGLPLRGDFVTTLCQGILETRSLQHLSLSKCGIMDDGAEVLCTAVRNAPSIVGLDLSNCELTENGAASIARLISYQKLNRYSEAWKQTLRYRDPDVEAMPGLRRLTLNHNPEIGDRGLQCLIEEVRDDLWLRALDLQDTGLTDIGGNQLTLLIRNNPNLTVVDARGNVAMTDSCLTEMLALLAINNADKGESEYQWLMDPNGETNIDAKKPNTFRKFSARRWAPPIKVARPAPKPSNISFGPSIVPPSSYSRSQSSLSQKDVPTWRLQKEAQARENAALRRQINELNDILSIEVKQKNELVSENENLRVALQKCQFEKKQLEDDYSNKTIINEETLTVLEETLGRLVEMYSSNDDEISPDDNDVPQLLNEIKAVLRKGNPNGCNKLKLKPLQSANQLPIRGNMSQEVIWEEEEPPSSPERDNTNMKNKVGLERERKTKAQELFSQLLNGSNTNKQTFGRRLKSHRMDESSSDFST